MNEKRKLISIVTPCYNEEGNIERLYAATQEILQQMPQYDFEHIFIDNRSTDRTVEILRELANKDPQVKLILNSRNFGHIRSPVHGLLQAQGDAAILLVADLQDPPPMILEFVKKWEEGYKVAIGVKQESRENPLMFFIRKRYYDLVGKLSSIRLVKNFTGFGLYDHRVLEVLRQINDPYPYFRGLICDIGFERAEIAYTQPSRQRGITKNNWYTLYDIAMLGITSHSLVPLRVATIGGFLSAITSLLFAMIYLAYKLIFWESFTVGVAPLVIGQFFFTSITLFFIGIMGEYIGFIHGQVMRRPLVVEAERVNFNPPSTKE